MGKQKAFTLIELLVVIVIIGILATISIASFQSYQEKARMTKILSFETQAHRSLLVNAASQGLTPIIGNWEFNELNGNSFPDTSPNQITLTQYGGVAPIISTDTPDNSLGSFHSQVARIRNISKNIALPKNEITISAWTKILTPSSIPNYIGYSYELGEPDGVLLRPVNNGMFIINADSGVNMGIQGTQNINDGNWHHLLGTYDGSTATFYTDGKVVGTRSFSEPIVQSLINFNIGYPNPSGSEQLIDNFRIYPVAYTPE